MMYFCKIDDVKNDFINFRNIKIRFEKAFEPICIFMYRDFCLWLEFGQEGLDVPSIARFFGSVLVS